MWQNGSSLLSLLPKLMIVVAINPPGRSFNLLCYSCCCCNDWYLFIAATADWYASTTVVDCCLLLYYHHCSCLCCSCWLLIVVAWPHCFFQPSPCIPAAADNDMLVYQDNNDDLECFDDDSSSPSSYTFSLLLTCCHSERCYQQRWNGSGSWDNSSSSRSSSKKDLSATTTSPLSTPPLHFLQSRDLSVNDFDSTMLIQICSFRESLHWCGPSQLGIGTVSPPLSFKTRGKEENVCLLPTLCGLASFPSLVAWLLGLALWPGIFVVAFKATFVAVNFVTGFCGKG